MGQDALGIASPSSWTGAGQMTDQFLMQRTAAKSSLQLGCHLFTAWRSDPRPLYHTEDGVAEDNVEFGVRKRRQNLKVESRTHVIEVRWTE